jgi:DNA-binding NtrC family response regulator
MNELVEKLVAPNHGAAVLLVNEDFEYLEFVRGIIQRSGHNVDACKSYKEGIRLLESGAYDLVVVGQGSRNFEGRCVLECATAFDRHLPVIVVARNVEMGCYLDAMQLGAVDYISPGLSGSEITRAVQIHTLGRKSRSGNVKSEHATATVISAGLVA